MENYTSSEKDWEKYAFADLSRGYTRNLVDEGNGKSNLVSYILNPPVLLATQNYTFSVFILHVQIKLG